MPNAVEVTNSPAVSDGLRMRLVGREDLVPVLEQLAYNLRWSWDPATRALFESLAPDVWSRTYNPIAVLKVAAADPDRLAEHAESILERQADLERYHHRGPRLIGLPVTADGRGHDRTPDTIPQL